MELTFEAGGWWSYLLVFLAAATPVVEVLVVVPAGILAGMPPVPTAVVATAGNLSTVVLVAFTGDRILGWWGRRRPARNDASPSRRSQRARDLARRWGVPGLAFLAPLTTGTHIATVAALATGSDTRRVLRWMAAGLVFWSVVAAAATVTGLDLFT
ncbi:small multi-drug export protein [Nitriliruptor alkaliphilus]|uniref:small multi-drug export protein n=1 Tax=Nitriliruptor alkaliphilus TaxID=427918 RepID=UPI00069641F1|nr:small multi-drug export protein [Nitriliruptor alkaliphilus]